MPIFYVCDVNSTYARRELCVNGLLDGIPKMYFSYFLAGFTHSAFAFGYEASISKCPIDGSLVPPGALITFVQKGLQYIEMEANLSNVSICLTSLKLFSSIYFPFHL